MKIDKLMIIGVLISVFIGLLSNIILKCSTEISIIIGLLIEIVSLQLHLISNTTKNFNRIGEDTYKVVDIVRKIRKAHKFYDVPGIKEQMQILFDHLSDLSNGTYYLKLRPEVYLEDTKLLQSLGKGDAFCATVLLSNDFSAQFRDFFFCKYIDSQIDAVKRGAEVERLYLLRNSSHFKQNEVQVHLNRLYNEGINVTYILCDRLDPTSYETYANIDLLLFGNWRVSSGKVDFAQPILFRTFYSSDEKMMRRYKKIWETMNHIATPFCPADQQKDIPSGLPQRD
jgi:hypothetical protein